VADFPGRNECLKVPRSFHLKLSYWLQLCRLYLSQGPFKGVGIFNIWPILAVRECVSSSTAVQLSVNRIETDSWKERRLFLSSTAAVDTINDQVIRRMVDNAFRSMGLTCLFLSMAQTIATLILGIRDHSTTSGL